MEPLLGPPTEAARATSKRCCSRIAREGPLAAGDLRERVGKKGQWWDWDDAKVALEHLFWAGTVTAVRRAGDFARLYDLAERVIPAHVLDRPTSG